MKRFTYILLVTVYLGTLGAQQAEVLMMPLTQGPLAPLSKELTQRMQQELGKSGISVNFVPRNFVLPLSEDDRATLFESARVLNLPFVLVQAPDLTEKGTIRHDLYKTFDGTLLASILVKGDSGRAALLRSVLLAKEIQNQLKELPPIMVINQGYPSNLPKVPLLLPPTAFGPTLHSLEVLGGYYGVLGPASDFLNSSWNFRAQSYWLINRHWGNLQLGPSLGYWSQEAKGPEVNIPLQAFNLEAALRFQWSPWSWLSFHTDGTLGAGLLTIDSAEGGKYKLLPSGSLSLGVELVTPVKITLTQGFRLSLFYDPTLPLSFYAWEMGLGYQF